MKIFFGEPVGGGVKDRLGARHLRCLVVISIIIQLALHIFWLHICRFNQTFIRDIQEKELQKNPKSGTWICCVLILFVVVQSLSRVWLFVTPWTAAHQAPLSSTISRSLLKLMSLELVMPSNHLILCHNLLLLPSIFPSIKSFPVSQLSHQVTKVLELQL